MEDCEIVRLYYQRDERAIAETDQKYGAYCRYIADRILCDPSDAQEIVNDTYVKVWQTVPPNLPTSLKFYVGMLCRQLSINRYEARAAEKRGKEIPLVLDELQACIPDKSSGEDLADTLALRDALNRFVKSLDERARLIFVRRYWYSSSVSEIAKGVGMKENTVSAVLLRVRKKLKIFLTKEGFDL